MDSSQTTELRKRERFFAETLRQYHAVCGEILRSQGERPQLVEVKRKKKRFTRKALRESFRKLFSDESEDDSGNKSFHFRLPRRKKRDQQSKDISGIEQLEKPPGPGGIPTKAVPEDSTSSEDDQINMRPLSTSTPTTKI